MRDLYTWSAIGGLAQWGGAPLYGTDQPEQAEQFSKILRSGVGAQIVGARGGWVVGVGCWTRRQRLGR